MLAKLEFPGVQVWDSVKGQSHDCRFDKLINRILEKCVCMYNVSTLAVRGLLGLGMMVPFIVVRRATEVFSFKEIYDVTLP